MRDPFEPIDVPNITEESDKTPHLIAGGLGLAALLTGLYFANKD